MYCPTCAGEFREGIAMCPDCGVPLTAAPPSREIIEEPFVKVFRTADASLLPVIESVLGGADIPYLVQGGEALGGLYPLGTLGGGEDDRLLGAIIQVPESRKEAAEAVLVAIDEGDLVSEAEPNSESE